MKTKITTNDIVNILTNIVSEQTNKYVYITNQYENTTKEILTKDFLDIKFYGYKNDIKDHNLFAESEDGFNFPNLDNFLNANRGNTTTTYALVELTNEDITPSADIDMGGISTRVTFLIQEDKISILEDFILDLKRQYLGIPQTIISANEEELTAYFLFSGIEYEQEPIQTALGMSIVATMTFDLSYMQSANNYQSNNIKISLDDINYYDLKYLKATQDFIFTPKSNIKQNTPYASGSIVTSLSYSQTFTFWSYKYDTFIVALNYYIKNMIDDETLTIPQVNIPVYVKEDVNYYLNDELQTKTIKTKMVVINYKVVSQNSDFNSLTLTLNRYGKV